MIPSHNSRLRAVLQLQCGFRILCWFALPQPSSNSSTKPQPCGGPAARAAAEPWSLCSYLTHPKDDAHQGFAPHCCSFAASHTGTRQSQTSGISGDIHSVGKGTKEEKTRGRKKNNLLYFRMEGFFSLYFFHLSV